MYVRPCIAVLRIYYEYILLPEANRKSTWKMDETLIIYFLSFWSYFQGLLYTCCYFRVFFFSLRFACSLRESSGSTSLGCFIVWELLRPQIPLAVLCQPGPSGVVTSSWRARRTCQRQPMFLGRSWVKTCWSKKSYGCGKICHFYMFFLPGIPGYLNWFRRFLPPLAWFGNWWDQHKMSKTSILQFHSLSDFTGDSPWTQTSSSFLISGKNIISQFPSHLCFTFLSWTHPTLSRGLDFQPLFLLKNLLVEVRFISPTFRVKCSKKIFEKQILRRFCAAPFSKTAIFSLGNSQISLPDTVFNGTFHHTFKGSTQESGMFHRFKKWLVSGQGWWFTIRGRNLLSKLTTQIVWRIWVMIHDVPITEWMVYLPTCFWVVHGGLNHVDLAKL